MKIWMCIFILLGSLSATAENSVIWEHRKKPQLPKNYELSLKLAKEWATKYYKDDDIVRFIYSVDKLNEGFEVMITAVYKGEFVATDGEMCIQTNAEHRIIKVKQCIAP